MTDKRYYGLYKAVIVDTNDPLGLGRITVQVPQVTGLGVSNWIESCSNGGGVVVPAVGSTAWVMYMDGDPNFPVWMGV